MPAYELIITDVTRYGTLFCVAGWDLRNGRMIRPEPASTKVNDESSRFWKSTHVGAGKFFDVGNIVRFDAVAAPRHFAFPHATEDRIFVKGGRAAILGQNTLAEIARRVAAGVSPSMHHTFGGHLNFADSGKAYVEAGIQTYSLDSVEMDPRRINVYVEIVAPDKSRVRAQFEENGVRFDFSIPAHATLTRFFSQGIEALRADIRASHRIHLRLGLSRPFGESRNCYVQVNGLYFL